MRKVNATLGRKRSEGQKARSLAAIEDRRARGKRIGAPISQVKHVVVAAVCETCGKEFLWTASWSGKNHGVQHQKTGRFCSKRCLVEWLHKYRQLLPHANEIKRLYWDEGLSLWDIARRFGVTDQATVKKAMAKAGIARRYPKNIGKRICIVQGCEEPAFKIVHPNNKSPYGRRCEKHWLEHRQKLRADYHAKVGGQYPAKIATSMANGNSTSESIAFDTGLSARTVWITLGRMRMNGRAEIVGHERSRKRNRAIWRLTTNN